MFFQQLLGVLYPQINYPLVLVVKLITDHYLVVVLLVPQNMRPLLQKHKACCPIATKRMGRLEQARYIPQYSLLSKNWDLFGFTTIPYGHLGLSENRVYSQL